MEVATGDKLGTAICAVLGLKQCTMLNIHVTRWSPATVVAKLNIDTDQAEKIANVMKRYRLEEIKDTDTGKP
jgi:hypothetical protein